TTYFFKRYTHPLDLHSFPTRRSSDLDTIPKSKTQYSKIALKNRTWVSTPRRVCARYSLPPERFGPSLPFLPACAAAAPALAQERSEEHTSELQSRENLVCRLLLEKKN